MSDDLKLAVEALQGKQRVYTEWFDYYRGVQPLRYAAERLREIFQSPQTTFVQNWCSVVVDAVLDRLNLARLTVSNDEALTARLGVLWQAAHLDEDADAILRASLVTGEAYVLAWRSEGAAAGEVGEVEAYYHDPRLCHLWYEVERPRVKRMGAKWWRGDDKVWRLNLYYSDRIEKFGGGTADVVGGFRLLEEVENPWGVVPLFQFARDRYLRQGELVNVLPLQDAINKLLGDMMIAAEFGAFRQRWIVTNADTSKLRNAPNEIWEVPAAGGGEQPTALGEFAATDLSNYLDAIDRLAASIGVISRTPKHYFFAQGGDPSGEALLAMEAALVRKVRQYQERFTPAWQELAAFLLRLDGVVVAPQVIMPVWDAAATVQPRMEAEILQLRVAAGEPLVTVLRREGRTDAEIAQLLVDKEEEAGRQQTQLSTALMRAQQEFDQGEGVGA